MKDEVVEQFPKARRIRSLKTKSPAENGQKPDQFREFPFRHLLPGSRGGRRPRLSE